MRYIECLVEAMKLLGENKNTIFVGQSVKYKGTGLFWTLEKVPMEKRIELPVFEDVQMGVSIGLALEGYAPVSIYPRMDFLVLALNQLVNHLDKFEEMSDKSFKPKVIIRTAIGSVKPLFPGPQHIQDHTEAIKFMCKNIHVVKLTNKEMIIPEYQKALDREQSTILIEIPDLYET